MPIRRSVFVEEQGIDESEEWDEFDAQSIHAIAWLGSQAVGTARLLPDGKIGRMAVLKPLRRKQIGAALLGSLIELARVQGFARVKLSAQLHAMNFYLAHGFVPEGKQHEEVGIPHQWMTLNLTTE